MSTLASNRQRPDQLPVSTADLLNRGHEIAYRPEARALVAGKRILVTGAGGSIGSEIVRQLSTLGPGAVYLLDHDESALHTLQLELQGHGLLDDEFTILADIRDRAGVHRVFGQTEPELVYHAAAHKHLPLLERFPSEGVKTNVLGTENVVGAAVAAGVARFINVSTDKAASPTSVLGATKRLAEIVVASHAGRGTRVASVRFGNVLGSRGSFLQSLMFQIANGDPVTVTDRDVSRFFMTIPEAAGLVIEASVMAHRGETYVLDMGEQVRIVDLIDRYVTLTGTAAPDLRFTGLRQGEKLHEELLDSAETRLTTAHPGIWAMKARHAIPEHLRERLSGLHQMAVGGQVRELLDELADLLPEGIGPVRVAPTAESNAAVPTPPTTRETVIDLTDTQRVAHSGAA